VLVGIYISISNDHIFPAIVMPYVKDREGKSMLELLQDRCPECKFTNGIVYSEFKWIEKCEKWDDSDAGRKCVKWSDDSYNQIFASREVFENLLEGYLSHSIFSRSGMALGINAYAPGACVYRDSDKEYLKSHYCKSFINYNKWVIRRYGEGKNFINFLRIYGKISGVFKENNKDCTNEYDKKDLSFELNFMNDCNGFDSVFVNIDGELKTLNICALDFGEQTCTNNLYGDCAEFNAVDPPLYQDSEYCWGIYQCKEKFYSYYLDKFNNYPLFISEIGSQSSEFSAHSSSISSSSNEGWINRPMTENIYGITNIKDYQEQVDMIESDVYVFLSNEYLRSNKKLKGIMIFSDNLLPEKNQLFYYDFPPTGKASNKYIELIGEGR